MKPSLPSVLLLAFPLAASSFLASCVSNDYQSARHNHPSGSGYATYVSLPPDYSGDAYYYNNRYYAGGRYEPGTYSYRGRTYDHRYFHNGQYFYGGDYRQTASGVSTQSVIRRTSPTYLTTTRRVSY